MRLLIFFIAIFFYGCQFNTVSKSFKTGASQLDKYIGLLQGKRVAIIANQTSQIDGIHLVDTLLSRKINLVKIFAPEHGFRGITDAGFYIEDQKDTKTELPIFSLYGNIKKPSKELLNSIDILVFDIQDVGVRFYTYISTLHYVMEACAESSIPLLVLDRPNPNAHYIDGPILDTVYKSFVGMHPVPIVHGMTIAEYAQMINGEYWLKDSLQCKLFYQKMQNYNHQMSYDLPVLPSPNLPNSQSIKLYPSLCLFEGTDISVGRGTNFQFQRIGSPYLDSCLLSFTPRSMPGATYPKHNNISCCGWNLAKSQFNEGINLYYLINTFKQYKSKKLKYFNSFFDKLAGSQKLRRQIESGMTSSEIKESWKKGLKEFKQVRKSYLLYP